MAWTQNQKIAAAIGGVAVVGGLGYLALRKKEEEPAPAAAAPPPATPPAQPPAVPPAKQGIDAMYAYAPAVALDAAGLPVLRPIIGDTAGSSYWILGDDAAAGFAPEFTKAVAAGGNEMTGPVSSTQPGAVTTFISDFGAQMASHGTGGLFPADVWVIVLGKQEPSNVGAMKESIANIRGEVPHQRILWVLTKSAPAEVAQAISEAKEEWFRSSFDDPAIVGMEAAKAAQAQDVQAINAAFPAPAPTAKPA